MWYFQSTVDEERKFVILPGKEYVIGRRDCDIVIENDQSVSRKHAFLKVTHNDANVPYVNKPSSIALKDISKFGTFVNNHKVKGERQLRNGDEIRFGNPKSVHRIVYEPFIVTTSCVDGPGKKDVRTVAGQIGGHVSNDWRKDCSYLVMKTVTVTIKVVCALVSQKPIVTPDFLRDLLKYLKGEVTEKPKPDNYLPAVTDGLIRPGVSFHPNARRSAVFMGMTFHFLSNKQFQKMSMAVECGGGVPILSDNPKSAELEDFLEDKAVVMNPAPGEVTDKAQKEWIEKVKTFLQKKDKHMVQDAEIGYAVLYCSTEDYCNPDKDVSHLLSTPLVSQSLTQAGSLASQVLDIGSHIGRPPAPFRKPEAGLVSARSATASDSSGKGLLSSDEIKPDRDGNGSRNKREAVFTVPESLTETPGMKNERPEDAESAVLPVPVASIKEESLIPESENLSIIPSRSGDARESRSKGKITATVPGGGRQTRSRSRSPVSENDGKEGFDVGRRQSRSRSPVSKKEKGGALQPASASGRQTRSRSPAKPDTQASLLTEDTKQTVKVESEMASMHAAASEVLFDSEMPTAAKVKKERETTAKSSKPVTLLDDDDDEVMQVRKPAPSRNKRRHLDVSSEEEEEEEEDPFDFVKKRPRTRRSPSPAPKSQKESPARKSPSPVPESCSGKRRRSPSPAAEVRREKASRSASPKPERLGRNVPVSGRNEDADESAEEVEASTSSANQPASSSRKHPRSPTQNGHDENKPQGPVPHGFLTTRQPIKDQVEVNPNFEHENVETSVVLVQFEDLITRPARVNRQREDQSDVPEGMMRWNGKLVRNFKKFNKTKHVGADCLPRIIGGRDLEEYCGSTKKALDGWLKDFQEAETQQTEREREAQELFDWKPSARGNRGRR